MTYGIAPPIESIVPVINYFYGHRKNFELSLIIESHSKTLFRKNYPDSDLSIL